jgi:hypothetical protein
MSRIAGLGQRQVLFAPPNRYCCAMRFPAVKAQLELLCLQMNSGAAAAKWRYSLDGNNV